MFIRAIHAQLSLRFIDNFYPFLNVHYNSTLIISIKILIRIVSTSTIARKIQIVRQFYSSRMEIIRRIKQIQNSKFSKILFFVNYRGGTLHDSIQMNQSLEDTYEQQCIAMYERTIAWLFLVEGTFATPSSTRKLESSPVFLAFSAIFHCRQAL